MARRTNIWLCYFGNLWKHDASMVLSVHWQLCEIRCFGLCIRTNVKPFKWYNSEQLWRSEDETRWQRLLPAGNKTVAQQGGSQLCGSISLKNNESIESVNHSFHTSSATNMTWTRTILFAREPRSQCGQTSIIDYRPASKLVWVQKHNPWPDGCGRPRHMESVHILQHVTRLSTSTKHCFSCCLERSLPWALYLFLWWFCFSHVFFFFLTFCHCLKLFLICALQVLIF